MLNLLATTTFGLERVVVRELAALGLEAHAPRNGRVTFSGDARAVCEANLWLRVADRVLLIVGEFPATDFGQLFDQVNGLPWEEFIPADGRFTVRGRSIKSQLSSVPACQRIVKKAIAERLLARHAVSELPETGGAFTVEVSLLKDDVTLTLDTTGDGLHKRGYRNVSAPAPLKETLAAAMVLLSDWGSDRALIDPFCGSGTIPIEAAMIGRNQAPGVARTFASERWPLIPTEVWDAARADARSRERDVELRISGTDIDESMLRLSRHHAERAGVAGHIHWQERPFSELSSKRTYGCVIGNPPYGERIGDRDEVRRLYRQFPDVLRRLPTWSHYFLTPRLEFEKLVGQKADRSRRLYNGRIECRLYEFHGPRPPKSGEAPAPPKAVFGGTGEKEHHQVELFTNRLRKRARHLRRWPSRGIEAYRLYDRDIPEIPVRVDRYGEGVRITGPAESWTRSRAQQGDWLDLIAAATSSVLDVPPDHVVVVRGGSATVPEAIRWVREGDLSYQVNLADPHDTGLRIDHRLLRELVGKIAGGTRMLNLSGDRGAFSVAAIAGGAVSTVSQVLSDSEVAWVQANLARNKFDSPEHRVAVGSFRHALDAIQGTLDLVVLDPIHLASGDEGVAACVAALEKWLGLVAAKLAPGATVLLVSSRMRPTIGAGWVGEGVSVSHPKSVPEDFRSSKTHRAVRLDWPE